MLLYIQGRVSHFQFIVPGGMDVGEGLTSKES